MKLDQEAVRKIFKEMADGTLPSWKQKLEIPIKCLGIPVYTFVIEFNIEEWNFFPSMEVVFANGKSIWISEYSNEFEATNPPYPSEGSRPYYQIEGLPEGHITNLDGNGKQDQIDEAIDNSLGFVDTLKKEIDALENLADLRKVWIKVCQMYNFNAK